MRSFFVYGNITIRNIKVVSLLPLLYNEEKGRVVIMKEMSIDILAVGDEL
jgi:hypothetical protein